MSGENIESSHDQGDTDVLTFPTQATCFSSFPPTPPAHTTEAALFLRSQDLSTVVLAMLLHPLARFVMTSPHGTPLAKLRPPNKFMGRPNPTHTGTELNRFPMAAMLIPSVAICKCRTDLAAKFFDVAGQGHCMGRCGSEIPGGVLKGPCQYRLVVGKIHAIMAVFKVWLCRLQLRLQSELEA
jgi:hypothetical protein